MNNKFDGLIGLVGIGLGLVGIGYAFGTHSKMAKISDNLERSIDDLASQVPVDIPNDMIERAVDKAVAYEVKQAVCKVTDKVKHDVAYDMHKQVSDVIEQEYSNVKDIVLKELTEEAAKIDAKRVRYDVEKAAKEKALEKFEDNLDDILENFNDQLKNTSKIYTSIAESMTNKYKTNDGGTVLRIG